MNSEEAKFILQACRQQDLDANEPRIAEALEALEADPKLAEWFAAQLEFDCAVSTKLRSHPVPNDLLHQIRAGQTMESVSPGQPRWGMWLKLVALLLVLFAIAALFIPKSRTLEVFRTDMAQFLDQGWDGRFDIAESNSSRLIDWLESQPDPVRVELPERLVATQSVGCKLLEWHHRRAALLCFLPKGGGTVVHIIVLNRSDLKDPPEERATFARSGPWNTAAWSRGQKVYLALTAADERTLASWL